jgi:probable F420-dependent oxidoreductase
MEFGVVLPTYFESASREGILEAAHAAEEAGFYSIWVTDHVILLPEEAAPYASIFEALVTLSYVAARTSKVSVGASVMVVPQRNAVVLAKEIATLDRLCSGRLIIGVGAGWNEAEFRMLDAHRRFKARGTYLDEAIRLWRHLWSTPDEAFVGQFHTLPPVAFAPAPFTSDGPPIWIGGSSTPARIRAATLGQGWHPSGLTASELSSQSKLVHKTASEIDRPVPLIAPRMLLKLVDAGAESVDMFGRLPMFMGTPAAMMSHLKAYEHAGADQIICVFDPTANHQYISQMNLFAREVMPSFGDA